MTLIEKLRFQADVGDMGRKPDPTCALRQAATALEEMLGALEGLMAVNDDPAARAHDLERALAKARATIAKVRGDA